MKLCRLNLKGVLGGRGRAMVGEASLAHHLRRRRIKRAARARLARGNALPPAPATYVISNGKYQAFARAKKIVI